MFVQNLGDGTISFVFAQTINKEVNQKIVNIYRTLKDSSFPEELSIYDIVPTYLSITFHFDPLQVSSLQLETQLWPIMARFWGDDKNADRSTEVYCIPVKYNGPDLTRVSQLTGKDVKEIISLHQKPLYHVAMIGFKPHFPYLIGLDQGLATERLASPRLKVPAGSVAIGGLQTGIYPSESPGGWNLIGQTNPEILTSIKPGDALRFQEVH